MNKTEVEQIIKNANNSIEECENQIVKLEMVKAEAEKELKKSDEVPECYSVENGNEMYFVDFSGEVCSDGFSPNYLANEKHRAFKTKKIAKLFVEKTQAIADQLYFKELYDADYVPDWENMRTSEYYIYLDNSTKSYRVDYTIYWALEGTVYFSSKEIAQKCADWLNSKITNK